MASRSKIENRMKKLQFPSCSSLSSSSILAAMIVLLGVGLAGVYIVASAYGEGLGIAAYSLGPEDEVVTAGFIFGSTTGGDGVNSAYRGLVGVNSTWATMFGINNITLVLTNSSDEEVGTESYKGTSFPANILVLLPSSELAKSEEYLLNATAYNTTSTFELHTGLQYMNRPQYGVTENVAGMYMELSGANIENTTKHIAMYHKGKYIASWELYGWDTTTKPLVSALLSTRPQV